MSGLTLAVIVREMTRLGRTEEWLVAKVYDREVAAEELDADPARGIHQRLGAWGQVVR